MILVDFCRENKYKCSDAIFLIIILFSLTLVSKFLPIARKRLMEYCHHPTRRAGGVDT